MKEKNNLHENIEHPEEQSAESVHVPKYTQQQSVLYTIISIALFCLIYFGGKGILSTVNKPYTMFRAASDTSEELITLQYDYASISQEYDLEYRYSELEKNESTYKVSILFTGFDDINDFSENAILFEYGNAIENVENEFYVTFSPFVLEYVTATKYVDNDNPNNEILVFEYDGELYAEFQSYGTIIPTDVKILFDRCEKVY
ncbi:MAG: hypothetical protein J6A05_06055 [Oscillospiraceae bacterium]|nr:hypothetical protein [Oscillospiraceae bacterium]